MQPTAIIGLTFGSNLMLRHRDHIIAETKRSLVLDESGFAPRWYVRRAVLLRLAPGQAVIPHGADHDLDAPSAAGKLR